MLHQWIIQDGIKQFVPTIRVNCHNHPKWFNSSIRHKIFNYVRTSRRKYNRHPSEQNKFKLETNEKLFQTEINNAKANYESSLISSFSFNNSKIYKYNCSLTKSNPIPCSVCYNSISTDSDLTHNQSTTNNYYFLHNAFSCHDQFDAIYLDLLIQSLTQIYYLNFIASTFQVVYG